MEFGLTQDQINFIKAQLKENLLNEYEVWIFGSRSRGDFGEFSDLDLMIESNTDQQSQIGKLNEVFENSNLPIKVDLIQSKDFAESYRDNYLSERNIFFKNITV